jgi:drug/metabolite transporter (DMT)-like permease
MDAGQPESHLLRVASLSIPGRFRPSRRPSVLEAHPRPPLSPALVLVVAVLAISWAGPLVRFTEAPAGVVAAWRLVLSTLFLAIVVTFRPDGWAPIRRLSGREWAFALGAGVFLALHFWSWIASLQYTTVASSAVLVSTLPLFVAVLSAGLLREAPRRGEWVGLSVAVMGAAWIGWGDFALGGDALFGDALALLAAVFSAVYFVLGRGLRQTIDLWSYVGVVYGAAALTLVLVVGIRPDLSLLGGVGPQDFWVFLALAAGPMMLGHTGVNYALRYVRAYRANLALLGEPIGATLIAWWLPSISETPASGTLVGGALILVGVSVALRTR